MIWTFGNLPQSGPRQRQRGVESEPPPCKRRLMDLYGLVAPFLFIGAAAFFLPVVSPWLPWWRRPFLTGWAVSSLFIGSALCIDQVTIQQGSLFEGLAWAFGASGGLAVLTPLVWLRIHMWDVLAAKERRRREEESNARYRAKEFAE